MTAHQRHQEPPESQDADAVGTQAEREYDGGTQPQRFLTDEEERMIKGKLRVMQKTADETNINYATTKPATVEKQVRASEKVFALVRLAKDASLAVIDSKLIGTHADTAAKLGKMARTQANAFEAADFFDPLRQLLGLDHQLIEDLDLDEDEDAHDIRRGGRLGDWAKIGWMAMQRGRRAPGTEFMNGMMAVEHTKRAVNRRAKQKQVLAPEVRPQEIRQEDMGKTVNPTIANTALLSKVLAKQPENLNLFRWLINPRSFGQTVENVMYTSFLINTGKAAIEQPEDGSGIPVIYACEPPAPEDRMPVYDAKGELVTAALTKRQVIMEMNMEVWEEAIELFNIRTSIIPHREEAEPAQPGASGWYP